MANPSPEVLEFLKWIDQQDKLPLCWEINGKDKDGTPFSIADKYATKEEAEQALQVVKEWADPDSLEIDEVWDVHKSEQEWERLKGQ